MFTKEDYINANKGSNFNNLDYLHALFKLESLPFDVIESIEQLFSPKFKLLEGHVFLSGIFKQEIYENHLLSGMAISDIQFWMNLIEITGVFEGISVSKAKELAKQIVYLWDLQLMDCFGSDTKLARVIHDVDTDEVFVVIGTPRKLAEKRV